MNNQIKSVAVIGAGVSGVVTAAHLRNSGLDITVFERSHVAGGVWVYDSRLPLEPTYPSVAPSVADIPYEGPERTNIEFNAMSLLHGPPGPCYEGLSNNGPTELLELKLNSWPPGTESTVNHHILAAYIQDTALKHGTNEHTFYNTKVEKVSKRGDKWQIETSTLEDESCVMKMKSWDFDAVVVASGHYHAPRVSDIPGLSDWKRRWPSRIQHSKRYRTPKDYNGKNVLLIGGSVSSTDIAKELQGFAKHIYQSTRASKWDLPVSMLPQNATRVSEIASFNFNEADAKPLSKTEVMPGTAALKDGQELCDIDAIIVCTGYHFAFNFLKDYHRDTLRPEYADETCLVTDGSQIHNLHKDIFYIPDPTLAFVGVPHHIATFSLFEFQAIAITSLFSGTSVIASVNKLREEYNLKVTRMGVGKGFHSLRGKDVEYVNDLLAWINPTIIAKGLSAVQGHSKEWQERFWELWGDALKGMVEL